MFERIKKFNEKDYSVLIYIVLTLIIFYLIGIKDYSNYVIAVIIYLLAYLTNQKKSMHEIFIGINSIVFVMYFIIANILMANPPIVVVVSCSMSHSNQERIEKYHYEFLEKNFNYNKSLINSFPFKNGLLPGDVAVIKKENEYKVGDVIVFLKRNMKAPIIHRIIKVENGIYQTKGDNNPAQLEIEKNIKYDEIIGKVIFIIPKIGYLKLIFTKIIGISGVTISC